ncbi:TPA: ead/Ea22-like family protein [Escherichia coli]|nr:ead/Ea22-like family protein [Escherichia coli]HDW3910074.1 ead/Ea22-like family protein [Escherichia coli]
MSKIDYQALREAAEKATCGEWSLEYGEERFDAGNALIHRDVVGYLPICRIEGAHPESGFDEDFQMEQQANAEFIAAASPATVLALLDERERNQQYIKLRDQENEDIALTVGKLRVELEAAENNLIDSECHVAELEEALRDKQALLEASEKRIAELEAELVSQTYKLNELSGNSPATPDSWISCSERMPDTKTAVLVAVEFDRKGDWRMKWATYIPGHPDANDGWIIPGASWKPSHWMPLPEPPQEAK